MEDDSTSDYLENTCLNGNTASIPSPVVFPEYNIFLISAERRCDGPIIFVKEENKRLGGPFEVDIYANISLLECQAQCLRAEK